MGIGCVKTHYLKCWPEQYQAIVDNRKTFEYRRHDRKFKEGDRLFLLEFNPDKERMTGRSMLVDVTYILDHAQIDDGLPIKIARGYCVMAIKPKWGTAKNNE